jgi:hypothetical protein
MNPFLRITKEAKWLLTLAALTTIAFSGPPALAAESVVGVYRGNANNSSLTLVITVQRSSGEFDGYIAEDGSPIRGVVVGQRASTGDTFTPVSIQFSRAALNGSFAQWYSGGVAKRAGVPFMAGTFTHNGLGPFPWSAE